MTPTQLLDALQLGEDQNVEFKSAAGGLPRSMWETVSAFANTDGGWLVLGVAERDGDFVLESLRNPQALLKAFWDNHNNPQKLNYPVCRESDVALLPVDGATVLSIYVPRATRQQRPVFINGNPLTGTYKRNYEGDYRCGDTDVRSMLREASEEPRDAQIFEGFDANDLDAPTLAAFRNRFAARTPDHPFLAQDQSTLLESLGAWRRDRVHRIEGLTLAGLLMFGTERTLLDALPRYYLDYQEQMSADPEVRWTHRLTLDGKWAPNLFNFYYRVIPRLTEGIATPFRMDQQATRQDETHVHEALREALVNTLIHADHQSSRSITVIKRADTFIFQNPGMLRVALEQALKGGVSDPRNPALMKMFQLLGLGERAGSGFQKIMRAWHEQHWLQPLIAEDPALEMTRIHLPLASMIPADVERELRTLVGASYSQLDELNRVILMAAHQFGEVTNEEIQQYSREHSREIGAALSQMTASNWLKKDGRGRGTRYSLPSNVGLDLLSEAPTKTVHGVSDKTADSNENMTLETPDVTVETSEMTVEIPKMTVEIPRTTVENVKTRVEISLCTEQQVLAIWELNPNLTLVEVAMQLNKSRSTVERTASKLVKEGRLRFDGPRKKGKWIVVQDVENE